MSNALGLVEFAVFVAVIVGLAAGITWVVVRLNPPKRPDATPKS